MVFKLVRLTIEFELRHLPVREEIQCKLKKGQFVLTDYVRVIFSLFIAASTHVLHVFFTENLLSWQWNS